MVSYVRKPLSKTDGWRSLWNYFNFCQIHKDVIVVAHHLSCSCLSVFLLLKVLKMFVKIMTCIYSLKLNFVCQPIETLFLCYLHHNPSKWRNYCIVQIYYMTFCFVVKRLYCLFSSNAVYCLCSLLRVVEFQPICQMYVRCWIFGAPIPVSVVWYPIYRRDLNC